AWQSPVADAPGSPAPRADGWRCSPRLFVVIAALRIRNREEQAVWTPKRILLLVLGFTMFLTVYVVYAFFLGGIDGLPPLPEALTPLPRGTHPPIQQGIESETDRKLRQAFREDCSQVKKMIRME